MTTANNAASQAALAEQMIDKIKEESSRWQGFKNEIKKVIIGQESVVERLCIGLLSNGHILLEGVPGLAKTTLIRSAAEALGVKYSRIQFTPDLLPSDLVGTLIFNQKTNDFETRRGPIFANMVLADEINRAPAKVQAALLEAMQERQVTIGTTTYQLDKPFFVLATQNPIDQEGTYHLPEAQIDRFLFKVIVHYPLAQDEKEILKRQNHQEKIMTVLSAEDIKLSQDIVSKIYTDEKVLDYIVDLVNACRHPRDYKLDIAHYISFGPSPRATLALYQAARAYAFLKKRHFVIPDDVKAIAPDVLRHRILLSYEAQADQVITDTLIKRILETVPSP